MELSQTSHALNKQQGGTWKIIFIQSTTKFETQYIVKLQRCRSINSMNVNKPKQISSKLVKSSECKTSPSLVRAQTRTRLCIWLNNSINRNIRLYLAYCLYLRYKLQKYYLTISARNLCAIFSMPKFTSFNMCLTFYLNLAIGYLAVNYVMGTSRLGNFTSRKIIHIFLGIECCTRYLQLGVIGTGWLPVINIFIKSRGVNRVKLNRTPPLAQIQLIIYCLTQI